MQDIKKRVFVGYDVGTNDDESCVMISKGLNLEAAFYGKEAIAVLNLYNQFTEREAKIVNTLQEVIELVHGCCDCIRMTHNEELNATLQSLGLQE